MLALVLVTAMKNADNMLKQIIRAVDTSGDGKIQYEEFRVFVETAERQLLALFRSIDRDQDGRLNKEELHAAFQRAGLAVPKRRLAGFFDEIDMNRDGYISFDEWRDFLLFMPADHNGSALEAALSYYSSIVTVNAEGDSLVSEDTLEGLGYFVAGAVSGGVSRTATAPLDRLKVYLLVNTKASAPVALAAAKHGHPIVAIRDASKPIADAVASLWKAGGLRNFFAGETHSGNGLNVVKIMPESAIRFGSYEASKRFLAVYEGHGDPAQISTVSKFVAGGMGGMTAQFCVYPVDTLKFRLQCETVQGGLKGNALLIRTAQTMWADGGLRAAYRGLGLGLIGMFPYSAIDIGTFEFLKKSYTRSMARYYGIHEEDATPGNIATAILGATSGALGATVVYPLNVLRTRLQTQGTAMHPPTYTGIADVARKTIQNEGVRGLYKGLTPNILKVAPALSITWVCYENMKRILGLH
ncbi:mitochondrial carrier domain-containing protein [Lasiosphaeria miniovina]|uniref:Mitochondrial thiamine pyrophosphate carrier 1 n=1 Tax=Lasiosphaeria miniovina TaxID=1954250 RepID=A0AA40A482_9PEZI|nr:mitochondrial carrier domain-containing protein [Lasiosphaeria miniovina]KAK0708954.1 mitochondrial carrier domain-containing protein [Lasiosphaeria miniovina]